MIRLKFNGTRLELLRRPQLGLVEFPVKLPSYFRGKNNIVQSGFQYRLDTSCAASFLIGMVA